MKTLYLVRHGQSVANAQDIYQTDDSPLSEEGKKQARILQRRFKNIQVDAFYTSPLKRAGETAEIINKSFNLPIQTTDLIREWKKPSCFIGKPFKGKETNEYLKALRSRPKNPYWKWQDEESVGEVRGRVILFLEEMKEIPQKNILVVMHSVPLKMVLSIVLFGLGYIPFVDEATSFHARTSNTGITVLQLPAGKESWELVTWNDYAHLG